MQAVHQAAAMLPQHFNRILNLTVTYSLQTFSMV